MPVRVTGSILISLYLLTMVVLPHLHLTFDSHGSVDREIHAGCTHSHTSETPEQQEHDSDNCSFCKLLVLSLHASKVYHPITVTSTCLPAHDLPAAVSSFVDPGRPNARAPPYIQMV